MAEENKKENTELITAIYKVNLHCPECGSKIKKHLMTTQGIQNVDIDIEKGEIKAKGKIEPLKILKLIENKSKTKVELISPKVKPKETTITDKKPKETKDPIIRTISVKVHMHCDKCEADLKQRLIKHKGIFSVKTDRKAPSLTIEGTIEPEKLLLFLRKRVHKNAEIISIKEEKKEEKKEKGKEGKSSSETPKEKEGKSDGEKPKVIIETETPKKKEGKSDGEKPKVIIETETPKEKEGKSDGEKPKVIIETETPKEKEGKSDGEKPKVIIETETPKEKEGKSDGEKPKVIIETHQRAEEIKIKENAPYIIHYVYAPQLFSDENPNSCSIL